MENGEWDGQDMLHVLRNESIYEYKRWEHLGDTNIDVSGFNWLRIDQVAGFCERGNELRVP
jgi:hypothetical protein